MKNLDGAAGRSVIIDPAYLGDNVFDGVLARAIKVRNPGAYVGLVVRHPYQGVARHMPHVDTVHVFDKRGGDSGLWGLVRMAKELRTGRYDRAYVVHPSPRSAWLAHQAGITERRGFEGNWVARWSLTHRTAVIPNQTFCQDRLRLLDSAKTWPSSLTSLRGVLRAPRAPRPGGLRVGLVVGSQVKTKRWPIEHAAELVRSNLRPDWTWVLLGAPSERPLADALVRALHDREGVEDRVGEDIELLVSTMSTLDLVVAGDTGPLFIARALGIPTVGLFGPTSALRHQAAAIDRVLTADVDCRPCSAHGPRRCPQRHHRCLVEIGPERVTVAAESLLGEPEVEAG